MGVGRERRGGERGEEMRRKKQRGGAERERTHAGENRRAGRHVQGGRQVGDEPGMGAGGRVERKREMWVEEGELREGEGEGAREGGKGGGKKGGREGRKDGGRSEGGGGSEERGRWKGKKPHTARDEDLGNKQYFCCVWRQGAFLRVTCYSFIMCISAI